MNSRLIGALVMSVAVLSCAPALAGSPPQTWAAQPGTAAIYDATGAPVNWNSNGVNYDAPFLGAVAFVLDTPQTARRSIGANCTVAGNVALTFGDATTLTVPVSVGWQTFPFAITTVNTSGTTATCTYSNLK